MAPRLELQAVLVNLLWSNNVYFQPPPSLKMNYPCIVYSREYINTQFADNNPYKLKKRYHVTVIDSNPDSDIPDKVSELPLCSYNRFYIANGLNHDIFNLYF